MASFPWIPLVARDRRASELAFFGSRATALILGILFSSVAGARSAGDPIRLLWNEGDVSGTSTIYSVGAREPIGVIEYHQRRHGDRLSCVRIARFRDGSSDEDSTEARIDDTLEALWGHSVIRDVHGEPIVDLTIDVARNHILASWGRGETRRAVDETVALSGGTYWGPLIFFVLKNFDANADRNRLVFRTVAPTPKPMVLDMELTRAQREELARTGTQFDTWRFDLTPTIHWTIDPLLQWIAPRATFWVLPGDPPALARFAGPRNYMREQIVIQ
jgi:hypothetical protein